MLSMVWFHMLYDQIIWCTSIENLLDIVQPFMSKAGIYGIHNCNLVND